MLRFKRVDVGGEVYHVLNRSNTRKQIFDNDDDYKQFEEILEEAVGKFKMQLQEMLADPHSLFFTSRNGG